MPTIKGHAGHDGVTDSPEVVDLFLELAAIASPPGEERPVTDVVTRYLRDLGLTPDEDAFGNVYGQATTNGGDYGVPVVWLASVPEPSSLCLAGLALASFGWRALRRKAPATA